MYNPIPLLKASWHLIIIFSLGLEKPISNVTEEEDEVNRLGVKARGESSWEAEFCRKTVAAEIVVRKISFWKRRRGCEENGYDAVRPEDFSANIMPKVKI